jgi:serpin B
MCARFWTNALGLLLVCSTTGPLLAGPLGDDLPPDVASVVEGNNQFALDLYDALAAQQPGNIFFSPYSISTAFAMLHAGAAGETAEQMADVFHFELPQDELHGAMGSLVQALNDDSRHDYRLAVANRLWGQQGFPFLDPYLDTLEQQYGAGLESMDFLHQPDASRQTINAWVEEKTEQKIRDLLPEGSVTPDTRLVLTNAIYFLGDWRYQFDPQQTATGTFQTEDGQARAIPFMHQVADLRYGQFDGIQVLELPYAGDELSFVALLPDEANGLASLEAGLNSDRLTEYLDALTPHEVSVYLPRFEIGSEFSLGDTLAAMGMPAVFTSAADLSGIDGRRDLLVGGAYHKAFIDLNEEGTEAAAATGIVVEITSVGDTALFRADHPFTFLIRDNLTGSILFLGRVAAPTASSRMAVPEPSSLALATIVAILGCAWFSGRNKSWPDH